MLGAIIGDIVGSPFEFDRRKGLAQTHFPLYLGDADYTDDSLMTIAVADALMEIDGDETRADRVLATRMRAYAYAYPLPRGGFGGRFRQWLADPDMGPYGSWGNGAAMRVSPAGWLYPTLEETEHWAEITARVSHDHPEGLKGARVTAGCIFLARTGGDKRAVREYAESAYNLSRTLDEIRPTYHHVESCQQTVPEAITAFLESSGFEDAIRKAVSLGGDADTLTCICGGIAEAAYGIPPEIAEGALLRLPGELRVVLDRFRAKAGLPAL